MSSATNRILIIVVRYVPFKEKSYYEFPLGLAYISACLKRAGHNVDVLNLNHYDGNQFDLIRDKIRSGGYKYVMTGGLSAHFKQIKQIVDDIRRSSSEVSVIVGGGIVTSTPELMFNYLKPDFVVLGEGEITIVELINELSKGNRDPKDIKGIAYKTSSGEFNITQPRAPIINLDSLPWPDLEGFEFETYLKMQKPNDSLYLYIDDEPRFFPIISSRGCPFNCTFCYHPLTQKYRSRSVSDFISEIKHVVEKYNVNNLSIFDELISADPKRLFEICEELKKLPKRVHWMCQLRVDMVNEEMLAVLKDAGCFLISFGFESVSNKVLKSMNKHIKREQIERAMKLTRKAGIGMQGYFIFGDPAETTETAHETLAFWRQYKDYHITMGYIRPYPGSVLWTRAMKEGRINSFEDQISFLEQCTYAPPNMSQMDGKEWFDLQKNVQKEILLNDHFGEFISSERSGEGDYTITIRCPHCSNVSIYKNFHQRMLGVFKLACRNCNQTMSMTPLAFDHVREDYERNRKVFEKIKEGVVPVIVTPCMSEAEYSAMAELYLDGVNIASFMDNDDDKVGKKYLDKTVLKRSHENVRAVCKTHYFLMPLTRFANRIFSHLVSLGVDSDRICRLDEIETGKTSAKVKGEQNG